MKNAQKQWIPLIVGLFNVLYCIFLGATILYFETYLGRDLIFIAILFLFILLIVDINVFVQTRTRYAINHFLSLISAISASIALYFTNTYEILGDFTYHYGYKSSGWIALNWDAFGIAAFTGLGILSLLMACLFVLVKEKIEG